MRMLGVLGALACALWAAAPAAAQLPEPVEPLGAEDVLVGDFLDCLRGRATLISAHRGGPEPGYPENALETFANTLSKAPMLIETDVRQTVDGVLVLLHDETLERTTTGRGRVDAARWEELSALRLKDNDGRVTAFRVPRLEDALAWAERRAILQLDVKAGVPVERVVEAVARADARDHAAVIIYTPEDAVRAARADPQVTISAGLEAADAVDALEKAGVARDRLMAWTGIERVRPELWRELHRDGISAAFGTLWYIDGEIVKTGNDARYAELAESGADVLATDRHHEAFRALERQQDSRAAIRHCRASGAE